MIMKAYNKIIAVLNKVFVPTFWDCNAPVAVSDAKTPEGIAADVNKTVKPKYNYDKLKEFNIKDLQLTKETIPYCILVVTAVGVVAQLLAYCCAIAWYFMPIVFGCLIVFCLFKFKALSGPSEDYY